MLYDILYDKRVPSPSGQKCHAIPLSEYLGSGVVDFVQAIPQLTGRISQLFSLLLKQTTCGNKSVYSFNSFFKVQLTLSTTTAYGQKKSGRCREL